MKQTLILLLILPTLSLAGTLADDFYDELKAGGGVAEGISRGIVDLCYRYHGENKSLIQRCYLDQIDSAITIATIHERFRGNPDYDRIVVRCENRHKVPEGANYTRLKHCLNAGIDQM